MTSASPELFHGIDRALFVSAFVQKLRHAGITVSLGSSERAAQALEAAGPIGINDLYWIFKVSLTRRQDEFEVFDRVFSAIFDFELNRTVKQNPARNPQVAAISAQEDDRLQHLPSSDRGGEGEDAGVPWITRPSLQDNEESDGPSDDDTLIPELLPSALEHLADTPFDLLDEDELERIGVALEAAARTWPSRRSRRTRASHRGRPALRRTLRASLRSGGEPFKLHTHRPQRRPRPVLLLVDVSGSMEAFVRPYLHITRALAVAGRAEVFAFATELTRLTPALRTRSTEQAMERATEQVGDRFGGTKLASSLGTLLSHRVWGSMVRGAVIVVISDGWDTESPEIMDVRMQRLGRLAHRVIWVNPRAAAPAFEPLVGSMAAALPHCDQFLSGHSVRAMEDVLDALTA